MVLSTRTRTAVAATALTLGALLTTAAPAAASPAADQPGVHKVASTTYSALFAAHMQVYELVWKQQIPNLSPPGNEFVLRKLNGPNDGRPGSARYVYLGMPLPQAFSVGSAYSNPSRQFGIVQPLDPTTLQPIQTIRPNLSMNQVAGQVGDVNGVGYIGHYAG